MGLYPLDSALSQMPLLLFFGYLKGDLWISPQKAKGLEPFMSYY